MTNPSESPRAQTSQYSVANWRAFQFNARDNTPVAALLLLLLLLLLLVVGHARLDH